MGDPEVNYLLIHEDGSVEQVKDFDIEANLEGIRGGYLDVIRLPRYKVEFERLNDSGEWVVI